MLSQVRFRLMGVVASFQDATARDDTASTCRELEPAWRGGLRLPVVTDCHGVINVLTLLLSIRNRKVFAVVGFWLVSRFAQ